MSSSSSSSSMLSYSYNKLLPFTFEGNIKKPVICLAYDGTYIYAGTGDEGKVLRSQDGMFWDLYYQTNDKYVQSLYVSNNTLYIGTAPNGNIYTSNLITNKTTLSQTLGSEVSSFLNYNSKMYAFTSDRSGVYEYNTILESWGLIYSPYASRIYETLISNGNVIMLINSSNIIIFNGSDFYLQNIVSVAPSSSSSSSSSGV